MEKNKYPLNKHNEQIPEHIPSNADKQKGWGTITEYAKGVSNKVREHLPHSVKKVVILTSTLGGLFLPACSTPNNPTMPPVGPTASTAVAPTASDTTKTVEKAEGARLTDSMTPEQKNGFRERTINGIYALSKATENYTNSGLQVREGTEAPNGNRIIKLYDDKNELLGGLLLISGRTNDLDFPVEMFPSAQDRGDLKPDQEKIYDRAFDKMDLSETSRIFIDKDNNESAVIYGLSKENILNLENLKVPFEANIKNVKTGETLGSIKLVVKNNVTKLPGHPYLQDGMTIYEKDTARTQFSYKNMGTEKITLNWGTNIKDAGSTPLFLYPSGDKETTYLTDEGLGIKTASGGAGVINILTTDEPTKMVFEVGADTGSPAQNSQLNLHPISLKDAKVYLDEQIKIQEQQAKLKAAKEAEEKKKQEQQLKK